MKTILIPTDYSTSSLDCIHGLCNQFKNEDINLVFVHVFKLSDSITDLLMLSKRSREYEKVSDGFLERCNLLRKQYTQIQDIKIEFLYGSTLSLFKNFIEANQADAVLSAANCSYSAIHKYSIDPEVLIKKCGLPVINTSKVTHARIRQQQIVVAYEQELTEA
ncbi:hypothetical protein FFF34_006435 [Inquilinus sp. KBS0705]|nr:hypothetical protein FFF34_006435 [Inquilinus sp. KBS0705]